MSSYYLFIDESGKFESPNRYIVIGGLLVKKDSLEIQQLLNSFNVLKRILKSEELHSFDLSNDDKKIVRGILFYEISKLKDIRPIVYVFDLEETYIFKQYDNEIYRFTRTSFKYNKALDLLYRDLIRNTIISDDDKITIILDKIDLSDTEQNNIKNWLHNSYSNIKEVIMEDSKNNELLQISDLIVSSYPKKSKYNPDRTEFKLLNPFFKIFPRKFKNDYLLKK